MKSSIREPEKVGLTKKVLSRIYRQRAQNTFPDLSRESLRRFEKILQIENEAEREAMFIKELQSQIPVLQAKRGQTLYEIYLMMSGRTSVRIPTRSEPN